MGLSDDCLGSQSAASSAVRVESYFSPFGQVAVDGAEITLNELPQLWRRVDVEDSQAALHLLQGWRLIFEGPFFHDLLHGEILALGDFVTLLTDEGGRGEDSVKVSQTVGNGPGTDGSQLG